MRLDTGAVRWKVRTPLVLNIVRTIQPSRRVFDEYLTHSRRLLQAGLLATPAGL
jgi:hypothetical protein